MGLFSRKPKPQTVTVRQAEALAESAPIEDRSDGTDTSPMHEATEPENNRASTPQAGPLSEFAMIQISAIADLVNPVLEGAPDGDLRENIPSIAHTCRMLVDENPTALKFVTDLRVTAEAGAMREFTTANGDTLMRRDGVWTRLAGELDREFPDMQLPESW